MPDTYLKHRIVDFVNLKETNLNRIPGKIRRLFAKHHAGIPVPHRGFVIFPSVVNDILAHTEDTSALTPDQFPERVHNELREAYHAAQFERDGVRVAVRAALNVEDDTNAAYAGGSESPTNVLGENAFLAAVAKCISFSFNGRMRAYLERHGIDTELKLHILVHEMACSDVFAIVFTRNPFGSSDEVLVQATFGGGEPLTSGAETGDLYELDRSGNLLRRTIATKRAISTPEGIVPMPSELREKQTFTEQQLKELVSFALHVERCERGESQDCEIACSIVNSSVVPTLVQNRPVTTEVEQATFVRKQLIAEATSKAGNEIERLRRLGITVPTNVYSDQNIVEILTRNPSQMAFGMFTYIFAHGDGGIRVGRNQMGYDIGTELDDGFFELIAGQPRCSIVHDALTYHIAGIPLVEYVHGFVLPYLEAIRKDPKLANYPEVVLYKQNPSLPWLTEQFGRVQAEKYDRCYRTFFERIRQFERSFAEEYRTVHIPEKDRFLAPYLKGKPEELTVRQLVDQCVALLEYLRTRMCVWFVIAARLGFFAYARLRQELEELYDSTEAARLLDVLTAGLEDDPTIEFNVALAQVRDGLATAESVLGRYGHLGFNELEIAGPRYHENPELIRILAAGLRSNPKEEFATRVADCRRTQGELASSLGAAWSEWEQDIVAARTYLALRETVKFHYLAFYNLIRARLLAAERKLGWEVGTVFFLDPREIQMLSENSERAHQLAQQRKEQHGRAVDFEVPKVLFSDEFHHIDTVAFSLTEGTVELGGLGGSPFVAEGLAVIVRDPNDMAAVQRVREGSILVVPSTDPAWSPIICAIGKTGGLITEVGGPLAHGAIICREMGNAAVVDVLHATRVIRDGERVRIDGRDPQHGRVYLLDR